MNQRTTMQASRDSNSALETNNLQSTQPTRSFARQLSVLVVLPDGEDAQALQAFLRERGFRVVAAHTAFMAWEALAEEYFPIVVIDKDLGNGEGLVLCREVRNRHESSHLYLILAMANDSREEVVAGLRAGADDYVRKPVREGELLARINIATRIVRLERELHEAAMQSTQPVSAEVSSVQARSQFLHGLSSDVEEAVQRARALSVLVMDVDSFKSVNDRYGRGVGDELLRQLANRVRFALPADEDWLARIGGDEFAIVLPGLDVTEAVEIAERLRNTIERSPFHVAASDLQITASFGVGSLSVIGAEEEATARPLLDVADRYLYRSKLAGRNRVSAPIGAGARGSAKSMESS
jgi:diguanylate cyclase (GGDEF)-like protein